MAEPDIQTIPYFLVLLSPGASHDEAEAHFAAHVAFIDEMIQAEAVLLGGDFDQRVGDAEAAYLLHTETREEAENWAARDPLVSSGAYTARVVAWNLVGIASNAIDPRIAQ